MSTNVKEPIGTRAANLIKDNYNFVKSGLNKKTASSLFGVPTLREIGRVGAGTAKMAWAAQDSLRGGAFRGEGWAATDEMKAATKANRAGMGGSVKSLAKGVGNWGIAADRAGQGWGRARGIAARGALAYGALNVADFLNPFGFGSIAD